MGRVNGRNLLSSVLVDKYQYKCKTSSMHKHRDISSIRLYFKVIRSLCNSIPF